MADTKMCSVDGCQKTRHGRLYCSMHYRRLRLRGDVGSSSPERLSVKGKVCSVRGCGEPRRKTVYCASHYSQRRAIGRTKRFVWKWSDRSLTCVVCSDPTVRGFRQFCSSACRMLWNVYSGDVPRSVSCRGCGNEVVLTFRRNGSRRLNTNLLQCPDCRRTWRKHRFSVVQLAERDGTTCSICCECVDMELRHPEPSAPSVDHFVPRVLGGTNDPTNLRLAHLVCNLRKGVRLPEEMAA